MLNLLDNVIDKVLDTGWVTGPKPDRSFDIPDDTFRTKIANLTLNVYLVEIRENKDHRRANWDAIQLADRTTVLSQPPSYFDCHYLISAWSPVQPNDFSSPTSEEHGALGGALLVLVRNPDVGPAALGVVGGGPVFQQGHIYLNVAAPETPRVVNDFWSTMKLPWRPTISLIATTPLDPVLDSPPAPPMITLVQKFGGIDAASSTFEEFITIGGLVVQSAGGSPIAGALVVRTATGEQAQTDAQGRFSFAGLRAGTHHLRVTASGFAAVEGDIAIPDGPPESHIFKLS
jgi:Pvc16 N-terminal domain/Carboxypeptidase regulatory-like domain